MGRTRQVTVILAAIAAITASCGPRRVDVVMSEGIATQRAGALDAAQARYETALRIDPRVRGAANNLAIIALTRGEEDAAILHIKDELGRHPDLVEARLNRAWLLLRGGRYADAEAALEPLAGLASGLPPASPEALRRRALARALLAISRFARGAPWEAVRATLERPLAELLPPAEVAAADREIDGLTREVIGLAAARAGAYEAALGFLDGRRTLVAARARVGALMQLGRLEEAREALADLAGESPFDGLAGAWIALALGRQGDAEQALAAVAEPAAGDLRVPWHRLHAALASLRGDWAGALRHVDAAISATSGDDPGLWIDRAVALARLGRVDEARVNVIGVLRDHPTDARAKSLASALGQ